MFESDTYTIKQNILSLGNKYRVYEDEELLLKSKQKKFRMKEDFRFYDEKDNPVLKVTTDQILDVAASYTVVDERNDETVGAIKRNWTLLKHEWELIDSDNRVVGVVEEDNIVMALLRRFATTLIPFRYRISSQEGKYLGDLNGRFALKDTYELDLSSDDEKEIDRRLGVAAAVLIDAIEKN